MGNAAIWEVASGAANGTEVTAGDARTVDFNESPVVASGGHIFKTEVKLRKSTPEGESVNSNQNIVQDMGFDGLAVQITGEIHDSENAASTGSVHKLTKWMFDVGSTTGFTKGRFGLRMDDFPMFDVVPTTTYGYFLNDVQFIRDPEETDKVGFIAVLILSNDSETALGVTTD